MWFMFAKKIVVSTPLDYIVSQKMKGLRMLSHLGGQDSNH